LPTRRGAPRRARHERASAPLGDHAGATALIGTWERAEELRSARRVTSAARGMCVLARYWRRENKAPGRGVARAQHCTLVCFSHKFARRQDGACISKDFGQLVARIELSKIRGAFYWRRNWETRAPGFRSAQSRLRVVTRSAVRARAPATRTLTRARGADDTRGPAPRPRRRSRRGCGRSAGRPANAWCGSRC
jgi:hypothetical protein